MAEFSVRSDSVDVEQIMRQIRARIREKRGVDYTEAEVQQLAQVKLEKFLDPRGVRSDLVEQFRRHRTVSPEPPTYEFEDTTLYDTHRGLLRTMRRVLHPILKLFINPNPLIQALHTQKQVNAEFHKRFRQREEIDPLYYEVIHNLVLETTRLGIEVHNLKMRVESLSSRMDFDERRARALEGVVQYKKPAPSGSTGASEPAAQKPEWAKAGSPGSPNVPAVTRVAESGPSVASVPAAASDGRTAEGQQQGARSADGGRRRRRRRRRRPGQTMGSAGMAGSAAAPGSPGLPGSSDSPAESQSAGGEGGSDDGFDGPDDGPNDPGDSGGTEDRGGSGQ